MLLMLSWLLTPLILKYTPEGVGERLKVYPTSVAEYKRVISSSMTTEVNSKVYAGGQGTKDKLKYKGQHNALLKSKFKVQRAILTFLENT